MKDSGIDWIGKIPDEWKINKIDSLYTLRNTKVSDKNYPPLSVTMKGIVPQLATAAKSDDGDNRKLVKKGDFVINSRSDRRGSSGISNYDGSVSLINTVLTPREKMNPDYYNWLFHTVQFEDEFYKWGHGIVDDLWTTRWQDMKNISVLVPPEEAQEKIAGFLDKKCSEIDSVIEESKKSIEEYKAWKQSVIFEAVTGKNLSCKKKNSGIEWLGEIPETWEVCKLKYLLKSNLQYGANSSGIEFNENLPRYVRITDIKSSETLYEKGKLSLSEEDSRGYLLQDGDILFARSGATVGKTFLYHSNIGKAAFAGYLIRAQLNENLNPKFLSYYTLSSGYDEWKNRIFIQATIQNIGADKYANMQIPLPPLSEQESIAKFLDKKCAQIDSLISEKQSLIKDLAEYKKSLIFEAVTGKRRV
mgnify:CR=1 FL=1